MKSMVQTVLLIATSTMMFVACKPKSSDSGVQPVAPPVTTCIVGQVQPAGYQCINGQLIADPMGSGNLLNRVQFQDVTNSFTGSIGISSINGTPVDPSDTRAFTRYYGQVNISGTLNLTTPACGAPAGTYSISGTANFSAGTLGSTTLQVIGPASMQWQIMSALIWADNGYPETNGPSNKLRVTYSTFTINGINCGSTATY
jgi:hypothetical protein